MWPGSQLPSHVKRLRRRKRGQRRINAPTSRLRLTGAISEWFRDALARTEVTIAPLDAAIAIEGASKCDRQRRAERLAGSLTGRSPSPSLSG